jgi:hypothetical protein
MTPAASSVRYDAEGRPGGLVWEMKGERVEALSADHARLGDGRTIMRR